jgi:hypothetical protein
MGSEGNLTSDVEAVVSACPTGGYSVLKPLRLEHCRQCLLTFVLHAVEHAEGLVMSPTLQCRGSLTALGGPHAEG